MADSLNFESMYVLKNARVRTLMTFSISGFKYGMLIWVRVQPETIYKSQLVLFMLFRFAESSANSSANLIEHYVPIRSSGSLLDFKRVHLKGNEKLHAVDILTSRRLSTFWLSVRVRWKIYSKSNGNTRGVQLERRFAEVEILVLEYLRYKNGSKNWSKDENLTEGSQI